MNEKRILSVDCSSCGAALQVKTRAVEKTVACPKCGASMTVGAAAAAEQLPFATRFDAPQPPLPIAPLPMAEPLALPFAQPLPSSNRQSRRQVAMAGGVGGAVLVAVLLVIAFRSGGHVAFPSTLPGGGAGLPTGSGGTVTTQETVTAIEMLEDEDKSAEGVAQVESESTGAGQGGNFFEALSNAQIKAGANNPANIFPQGGIGGLQQGGRFPSVGNTQQRDRSLANGGRWGAMGLKEVHVPRR